MLKWRMANEFNGEKLTANANEMRQRKRKKMKKTKTTTTTKRLKKERQKNGKKCLTNNRFWLSFSFFAINRIGGVLFDFGLFLVLFNFIVKYLLKSLLCSMDWILGYGQTILIMWCVDAVQHATPLPDARLFPFLSFFFSYSFIALHSIQSHLFRSISISCSPSLSHTHILPCFSLK